MPNPFLIMGLPRSRTAWLANFLTFEEVSCGHEMSAAHPTAEALADAILEQRAKFVGNSDTFQCMMIRELLEIMPDARMVVVERSPEQVVSALAAVGIPITVAALQPALNAMAWASSQPNCLTIPYEALDGWTAIRAIHEHVAPGAGFSFERSAMLMGMNVQVTPKRIVQLQQAAQRNFTS